MTPRSHLPVLALLLGCGLTLIGVICRPPMPVDETRYLSVAWEMHTGGSYLVPHLNGEIYSHKPPLLFWLINLLWWLTGSVSDTAARLVAPAAALASLLLTAGLGKRLWPNRTELPGRAALMLSATLLWLVFSTLTMFDTLLTIGVLLALTGGCQVAFERQRRGWLVLGLGLGIGALAKGPVVLVHVMPALLAARVWHPEWNRAQRRSWLAGLVAATAIGLAVAACWVVPAIITGGAEYRDAILWKQTAGRMVKSFAHQQPFWWYLAVLPVLLLPWTLFPDCWRNLRKEPADAGTRFCLSWILGSLLVFSLVSGKQLYYLLPMFPGVALLLARQVDNIQRVSRREVLWMGSGTLVLGLALLAATRLPGPPERLAPWTGLPVLLGGMAILWPREQTLSRAIRIVAVAAVVNLAVFHAGLKDHYLADCDLQPVARKVARLQQAGTPVAYWGRYHGQFHFTGRLQQPLTQLDGSVVAAQDWLRANPGGVLFRDVRLKHCDRPAIQDSQVVWSRPFLKGLANHQAELVRYRAPDRPVISDTAAGPGTHAAIGRSPQQDF